MEGGRRMKNAIKLLLTACIAVFGAQIALAEYSETESHIISASGVREIAFDNLGYTDFNYRGDPDAQEFSVHFKCRINDVDQEEFDEMMEYIRLEITESDGKVKIRLERPKDNSAGIFKRLFNRKDWRVTLDVRGPSDVDMNISADFSKLKTVGTNGKLYIDNEFGDAEARDHVGRVNVNSEFGSVRCDGLDGSFSIDSEFGTVRVDLVDLRGDSRANASFGNVDIAIPREIGAEFITSKSFGSVHFRTSGDLDGAESGNEGIRILNGGGPKISLNSEFGDITVRNSRYEGSREKPDRAERVTEKKTEPKPRFEEGVVTSISFSGLYLLEEDEVRAMLNMTTGQRYTREQIRGHVDILKKHRFVKFTNFSISLDGKLKIHVYEVKAHDRDYDLSASFSRIGGVGIGPEVTVTSLLGPISEIKASGEYHFANSEWTYRALAEKRLFNDILTLGGGYRLDYESVVDWAIPRDESSLNALLFGLETKHFYQVEGAKGFVKFSPLKWLRLEGEYFEDKFSTVKKHTNWSVFNHRHVKDDNLPLSEAELGRLVGVRARLSLWRHDRLTSGGLRLELEHTLDKGHNTVGEYTRLLGNASTTWRLSRDNFLKVRLAGGYSEDVLPGFRAFNLGGLNTLRGYDYQSVPDGMPFGFQYGGNRMALMNVEYYLADNGDDIGFVLFGDAGDVWFKGQEVKFDNIRRDVGVGILFNYGFIPFDGDDIPFVDLEMDGVRVNWAVPVGPVTHSSNWTVNFVQSF